MPIYVYKCRSCEHTFEESHSIENRNVPLDNPCPECKSRELYMELFAPGLCFQGEVRRKPPDHFNDRLKEIKKNFPKNKINIIE